MTRLKSLILILTGILLFSCSPDNQEGEGGADTFTVRLDVPAGDFGGNIKTRWKAGDEISINGYAYKAQKDGVEAVGEGADKVGTYGTKGSVHLFVGRSRVAKEKVLA